MTGRYVALLRGINVGRAKRVAMADLRAVVEDLGYADVRTLLNSGNVVFTAPGPDAGDAGGRIEKALLQHLNIASRVTVLSNSELATAVAGNPLLGVAEDPSRLFVAFLADRADRGKLEPLTGRDWTPETVALGDRVAYIWCPAGMTESHVAQAVGRALGDAVTSRNWTTVTKLLALAESRQ
jgi:uncharacterized protein (DUF1697 family)